MRDRRDGDAAAVLRGAETIDLQEEGSPGVLLLHGFGDTPQTLALLARRLYKAGYGVYVPLLPGHGRSMGAFDRSRAEEWIDSARRAFLEMRGQGNPVSVIGLSMGGALAVLLAAEFRDMPALILIAPYLGMPRLMRLAATTHWFWGGLAGEFSSRDPRSIQDPVEREKNLAYGAVTARALFELSRAMNRARKALSRVAAPTLILQSREDPRVAPAIAEFALGELGAKEKQLVWTEGAGHILTVDYGRERIFSEIEKWLRTHGGHGTTAAAESATAVE